MPIGPEGHGFSRQDVRLRQNLKMGRKEKRPSQMAQVAALAIVATEGADDRVCGMNGPMEFVSISPCVAGQLVP